MESLRKNILSRSGKIGRERINRRRYLTLAAARTDVLDYIERFHHHRVQRRLDSGDQEFGVLTKTVHENEIRFR